MFHAIGKRIKMLLGFPNLTTFVFEFRGWNDNAVRDACHQNVGERDDEIRAKRSGPTHPPGVWEITSSGEYVTSVGTKIRVLVDPEIITEAVVQRYLAQIGIIAVLEHS